MSHIRKSTSDALRAWASLVSEGYEVPAAGTLMLQAANEIDRLRSALLIFADQENWKMGRRLDPNGRFDGLSVAQEALDYPHLQGGDAS